MPTEQILKTPPPALDGTLERTLSAQIASSLARAIVEGRYAPGERLSEVALAEALSVSRSPLREALRMLETRGLVRITPQRGARVTAMSHEEVVQLFDIRAVLVGLVARQVALRMDATLRQKLAQYRSRLEHSRNDAAAYATASAEITLELAAASGNPRLEAMLRSFAEQIGRYARLGLSSEARRERSLRNWRRVFGALGAGEADLAESLQRQLATENRDAVLAALDDEQRSTVPKPGARKRRVHRST
ncbi:MAG: GntR family transcriptional regulator [Lautropia sp.]